MRSWLPLLLLILAVPAGADSVDQEFTGPGTDASVGVDEVFARAQTFTVGANGTLTRIALSIARGGATLDTDELTIDVRPADAGGVPLDDDGSALASVVLLGSDLGNTLDPQNLHEIDLTAFGLAVAAGDELAIVARANVPFLGGRAFAWGARIVSGEGYPGGSAWFRPPPETWALQNGGGVDLVFRTWVPEPGAAGSALVAFGVLALRARRRFAATTS